MPGAPDPVYVASRRVLLDALDALRGHLDALVLVGAQAVYIHAGEADLAVAPTTTDGDLAIDPKHLGAEPIIETALGAAGFAQEAVGIWQMSIDAEGILRTVQVDLLVPDSLGGPGRRGARIPPHGKHVARKVVGLEGALVDREQHMLTALESRDDRRLTMAVAGPAALMVAKVHKIRERVDDADRLSDKDALDVYRLLRAVATEELVRRFAVLRENSLSRAVTEQALESLPVLFGGVTRPGTVMAVRAAGLLEAGATVAASLVELSTDFLRAIGRTLHRTPRQNRRCPSCHHTRSALLTCYGTVQIAMAAQLSSRNSAGISELWDWIGSYLGATTPCSIPDATPPP